MPSGENARADGTRASVSFEPLGGAGALQLAARVGRRRYRPIAPEPGQPLAAGGRIIAPDRPVADPCGQGLSVRRERQRPDAESIDGDPSDRGAVRGAQQPDGRRLRADHVVSRGSLGRAGDREDATVGGECELLHVGRVLLDSPPLGERLGVEEDQDRKVLLALQSPLILHQDGEGPPVGRDGHALGAFSGSSATCRRSRPLARSIDRKDPRSAANNVRPSGDGIA